MDNPEVFENTHRLLRELLAAGLVDGLRIDHPDGLYAPKEYFGRLQAMAAALSSREAPDVAVGGETGGSPLPLYIVVEKILASHEYLPPSWPVHGSTGYDFAAMCTGLFVDASAAKGNGKPDDDILDADFTDLEIEEDDDDKKSA